MQTYCERRHRLVTGTTSPFSNRFFAVSPSFSRLLAVFYSATVSCSSMGLIFGFDEGVVLLSLVATGSVQVRSSLENAEIMENCP